ncbi:FAD-binding oxidoreductase [Pseudonocardia parietis]|uniref:FAD/FMN-containing dehydrogenase n=1 Tax=Pseudonocardia parietis TaxID=570936 RepID=A0ABS4VZ87_9PSEU|nr:FAD-binding oxidoreductase [Pseudonocardia parietis]MBP2369231.1 FAD/FMN-containing dehydrogenase [Pseudonocardia parietis]
MTATVDHTGNLRARMTGTVVAPDDPGYDEARRVWNGAIDHNPALVARCADVEDVVTAVDHARSCGLEIAVRGGGHHVAGLSAGNGTLVIDLRSLNAVIVDPAARRVRAGGGALLRDVDAATQEHGLAVPSGEIGHTGIGGLTLGGGMGWLTRRYGLTIDHLLGAQVVLADGRVVRASADEHPDLFWALRGGGGNFGIVTEFEFAVVPVGPVISFGLFFFGLDDGAKVLRLARDLIPDLPGTVGFQVIALCAPPTPFVPQDVQFRPGWALAVIGTTGEQPDADAETVHARIRAQAPAPLFEFCTPMPFTALQQMFDEANDWGLHVYEKGCYLADLGDPVIEVLAGQVARRVSPLSVVHLFTLGGAYCEVADDATAFGGGRSPRFNLFLVGLAPDLAGLPAERAWVREFYAALAPHAIGSGVYINTMMPDDAARVRASFGDKYDRLAAIKAVYDPDNVFHRNANIPPAR